MNIFEYHSEILPSACDLLLIYSSETSPVKVDHEAKLDRYEMSILRWMCGFNLKDNKKNTKVKEFLGLESASLTAKNNRLRWFGLVERKDDTDWLKQCMKIEIEGTWQGGHLRKSWCDCLKGDMESLGLACEDAQDMDHLETEDQE